jgi:hypothetical protein
MNAFNPNFKDLKSNLKTMLLKGINSFEDGFEILDVDLEIDEHLTVDVLAKDAKANPTVVLMADIGETNLIDRILATLCQLRKHRFLLQRIYREHSFDFSVPPRILLLSSRFSDDFIEKLDFIVAGDILPYEYSALKIEEKEYLTFSRRDIEEEGEIRAFQLDKAKSGLVNTESPTAPEAKGTTSTSGGGAEPKGIQIKKSPIQETGKKAKTEGTPAERYFHEAKKKILKISNDIVEVVEGPLSRFKIEDRALVTLSRDNDVFSVFLGDTTEKRIKITSEEQLNEVLNQIFKRYFTAFSSISK